MGHDATKHSRPKLDAETAAHVAAIMQALATPSRVLILAQLREQPTTVIELAQLVEMEQSAVSHQLRLLRDLGLVTCERQGRTMLYDLHDDHVVELIDQAIHHTTHVRLGLSRRPAPSVPVSK